MWVLELVIDCFKKEPCQSVIDRQGFFVFNQQKKYSVYATNYNIHQNIFVSLKH